MTTPLSPDTELALELSAMVQTLVDLDATATMARARALNDRLADPIDILNACENALDEIGQRYEEGEYFISGLIMAGTIMNQVIKLVTPRLAAGQGDIPPAKVLIGTVKGDIHSLGKNIAGALLRAYGFEVLDLGVDVPAHDFLVATQEFQPLAVGLSVLLTSCFSNLADIVEALRQARATDSRPFIFISGTQISMQHQKLFKADYQAGTAFDTVRLCERLARGQYN
ncbi:5-methyltetrahydrofolate--homocysteine methyltransferase [Deltaproteobacteria bacterium]|nr:5-methyltetrahydrofolate--homocysteine methyltransferase [Deltaproteobacteria bacterium]